jgi:hypothetical protein
MEPRDDLQKTATAAENDKREKKRRFQLVKLEERIAPGRGGKGTHHCGGGGTGSETSAISSSIY